MLNGRKITATLAGETLEGSVAMCFSQRDILLPQNCEGSCRQTHRGTLEWLLYTGVCATLICKKFPNSLTPSSGGFEHRTTVVWYISVINLSTKSSAPRSIPYETMSLRWNLIAGHWTFFKCGAAECMNTRASKKGLKYAQSVCHYCAQSSCFLFCYVLFYEHSKDTNKALISKAILLTSYKNGQKFQLNCALSWLSDMKGTASW
jgi:hypothetical protein